MMSLFFIRLNVISSFLKAKKLISYKLQYTFESKISELIDQLKKTGKH